MAKKRKKRKSSKPKKMRVGECRTTENGTKYCKLKNGKVKFKRG